jgi:hypothetical protein
MMMMMMDTCGKTKNNSGIHCVYIHIPFCNFMSFTCSCVIDGCAVVVCTLQQNEEIPVVITEINTRTN